MNNRGGEIDKKKLTGDEAEVTRGDDGGGGGRSYQEEREIVRERKRKDIEKEGERDRERKREYETHRSVDVRWRRGIRSAQRRKDGERERFSP